MQAATRRPSAAARRFGYLLAAVISTAMWWIINEWPGWREMSFLTSRTPEVLSLVNLSLIVGAAVNLVYAVTDSPWLKALGELVSTGIGLAAAVRVWQVFPFDFSGYSINWAALARVALVVAIAGCVIGILVQLVTLIRLAVVDRAPVRGHD
jgi:hypothetical protein